MRSLEGSGQAGINRVWWDLRDEPSPGIVFRTKPLYADWVDLGDDRTRSGGQGLSMLMPPGTYTVTLEVDGEQSQSQELRVTTGTGQDGVRWAPKLAEELRYLAGAIMNGDFPPTDQAGEVQRLLNGEVAEYRAQVDELFEGEVAEFNRRLLASNLSPLISDG